MLFRPFRIDNGTFKHALTTAAVCFLTVPSFAAVRINEFVAASTERRITWDSNGVPHLGTGIQWMSPDFGPFGWEPTVLPAGFGFTSLGSNLYSRMNGIAPSIYLRKEFTVTPELANSSNQLTLAVQYNDGFVAYLNGRQIARANCGPPNHFMFASQPAYNVNTNTAVVHFPIGPAVDFLVPGTNLLAIQAHNAEQPSTVFNPELISRHLPTVEFRINAGLRHLDGSATVDLVPLGAAGGAWDSWVGRVEPSGGVVDLGLVTKSFTPPAGQEDDYEQPVEFSDWVELFNDSTQAIDVSGWSLNDDPDIPAKWLFPSNSIIPGGGYLLVLCDDRDEANAPAGPATLLHANFKLSNEGEPLTLRDRNGLLVDGFPDGYPTQVSSCSYGRDPTNPERHGFLLTATPGAPNRLPFYPARVEPPHFQNLGGENLPGGLYLGLSPTIRLVSPTAGGTIRYTLDGSEPTENNGLLSTVPIPLTQVNEKTGVVVRARSFLSGWLPSEVKTHSYVLKQPALLTNSPTLLLTGDSGRAFYAPDGLLAIVGGRFAEVDFGTIWQATGPQTWNNALGFGIPAERETHLEFYFPPGFYPPGQASLRITAGLRLSTSDWQCPRMRFTGAARNSPWTPGDNSEKPSFNLHFMGDYGEDRLNYPLYTNRLPAQFKHLRLRAGKNDNLNPFVTDELVRRLWIDMGHVGARGLFHSLYVNGVYKGVYNLCERIREAFFQNHYGSESQWDINYAYTWVDGNNSAYLQLFTALDRNLTNLVNYQAVADRMDIDNAADYYLLNIYCAMWDWPWNNFVIARERSTGLNSRFRFVVWDAEGAFNVIGYGHPASFNTITNHLILAPSNPGYNRDLSRIFRRLASAPEFRLRFADRVNRHLFNGGILDDRDPDAAGPRKSHFRLRTEELGREAGNLVRYNTGQAINLNIIHAWTSISSGRRTYLLGNTPGRRILRDAGLWPSTEPPVFSQFGGSVPPAFKLTMTSSVSVTGQTATIYYTLDGSDPRLIGGTRSPSAQAYSTPVELNQVMTVKARAQNDVNGEWSPLTEATFAAATEPANTNNLVIAELMYHPPGPTAAEVAAGFNDSEDFEFVRLLNIGGTPVDLAGVRFVQGITFDLTQGATRYLSAGANVLAVKNRNAFLFRYGPELQSMIAGEFDGNLANSGEIVQLIDTNNLVLRQFTYNDRTPWPLSPDGLGPSLILRNPPSNPDHASALNWMASAVPGGLPSGSAAPQTFTRWRSLFWNATSATNDTISGLFADPDGDRLSNYVEYTLGLNPQETFGPNQPVVQIKDIEGNPHLAITIRLSASATDATPLWEISPNLVAWSPATDVWFLTDSVDMPDGTRLLTYITAETEQPQHFLRLSFSAP